MKRFNITVNGKSYDVAVEEVGSGAASAPTAAPAAAAAPAPAPAAATPAPAGDGTPVKAPMSGNILDVKVNVGDTVSSGQVIIVLEAMKMENDIVAPCAGKVTSIAVKKGETVNSDTVLATIA
ncbi:MAG: biotin/lipoyl-binding protein [Oscillospiraceae bacterium]|nr:biotin/lipoyl-binding protein [Oscillospiraceae bacterium]